ncbi:MAG: hypothetical protein CMG25_06035 [Candidatus Marinimicrobia bacterium]|nr:hypothetical protein [Candidatus Neomarinimicrobiota bacterium]
MYKLLFILLFIYSCSDDNSLDNQEQDIEPSSSIRGYVLDASDNPIANADVYITYDMPNYENGRPTTSIELALASNSFVRVWVEDECGDLIIELVEQQMEAGYHSMTWNASDTNGKKVLDGTYIVTFTADDFQQQMRLALFSIKGNYEGCDLEQYPAGCVTIATTNSDGYFEFPQDCLSFGYSFTMTDEHGNEIGDYTIPRTLRIFVESEAGNKLTDLFDVDIDNGAEVSIQLDD